MSIKIVSEIVNHLQEAKYYSITLDCTSDVFHSEQLTVIVRFVNVKSVEVKEHFIRFASIGESSAASLTKVVLEVLNKYNIFIMDCHGQGYDNGANMAGKRWFAKANI